MLYVPLGPAANVLLDNLFREDTKKCFMSLEALIGLANQLSPGCAVRWAPVLLQLPTPCFRLAGRWSFFDLDVLVRMSSLLLVEV